MAILKIPTDDKNCDCEQAHFDFSKSIWPWKWGWWSKEGHWVHTTFWNAMSHKFHGGKIRYGRW